MEVTSATADPFRAYVFSKHVSHYSRLEVSSGAADFVGYMPQLSHCQAKIIVTVCEGRGVATEGRGSQEEASSIGKVLTGALGLHARYVYTGKRSR